MNDLDKVEFAELIVGHGEVYNKVVSKAMMKIYFDVLSSYSLNDVKYGFNEHSLNDKHGSFFPKPADIVRHLQSINASTEDKAELAWSQVIREIRATGLYGSLKLDDKQAMAAIRALGSWQQLCRSTESDMTWKKKEFMQIYQTYENTPIDMLPSSLPGLIDLQDHKKEVSESFARIQDGINQYRLNKGIK